MPARPEPKPGSRWKHRNGIPYTVLFLVNTESRSPQYPTYVVYQGDNGHRWSKRLSDWPRSMTEVPGPKSPCPECGCELDTWNQRHKPGCSNIPF